MRKQAAFPKRIESTEGVVSQLGTLAHAHHMTDRAIAISAWGGLLPAL